MKVIITVETDSKRYVELDKRIWENFPSIGGINTVKNTTHQSTLTFELGEVTKEEFQKFLKSEGLTANFQSA